MNKQELEDRIETMWEQSASMIRNGRAAQARLGDAYEAYLGKHYDTAEHLVKEALEFLK